MSFTAVLLARRDTPSCGAFRAGAFDVLLASRVASEGLDFESVSGRQL